MSDVIAVATGMYHTMIVKRDGSLHAAGRTWVRVTVRVRVKVRLSLMVRVRVSAKVRMRVRVRVRVKVRVRVRARDCTTALKRDGSLHAAGRAWVRVTVRVRVGAKGGTLTLTIRRRQFVCRRSECR